MADNGIFQVTDYTRLETSAEKDEYIEKLEDFIQECRKAAARGEELVSDNVYDTAVEHLRVLNPASVIFTENWTEDDPNAEIDEDLDKYLLSNPMGSILTIKSYDVKGFQDFTNRVTNAQREQGSPVKLHASTKMNGHGIRLVYKDGYYVKAHTRGRSSNGRDITHIIKHIVPAYIADLAQHNVVELRGEVLLPYSNMDTAREYNSAIKSPFTGVSSLMSESAGETQWKLLKLVVYACYCDSITLNTMTDTYAFLEGLGFTVPLYDTFTTQADETVAAAIKRTMVNFEQRVDGYDFFTDGVVISVDDCAMLTAWGVQGNTRNGNIAMKVGFWEQAAYSAKIEEIIWTEGKTKFTPVARIAPTMTANGATVQNVPLYNALWILTLKAYPGNLLYFKFGGEAGVVPCNPDGTKINIAK